MNKMDVMFKEAFSISMKTVNRLPAYMGLGGAALGGTSNYFGWKPSRGEVMKSKEGKKWFNDRKKALNSTNSIKEQKAIKRKYTAKFKRISEKYKRDNKGKEALKAALKVGAFGALQGLIGRQKIMKHIEYEEYLKNARKAQAEAFREAFNRTKSRGFKWKNTGTEDDFNRFYEQWGRKNRANTAKSAFGDLNKAKNYFGMSGVSTKAEAKKKMRSAALKHHPDKGGNPEEMKKVNDFMGQVQKSDWFDKLAFLRTVNG